MTNWTPTKNKSRTFQRGIRSRPATQRGAGPRGKDFYGTHSGKARDKEKMSKRLTKTSYVDHGYQEAWQRFQRVSMQLGALWKTKKNSRQILRAERSR